MKANGTRWGWQNPRFGTSGLQIRWSGVLNIKSIIIISLATLLVLLMCCQSNNNENTYGMTKDNHSLDSTLTTLPQKDTSAFCPILLNAIKSFIHDYTDELDCVVSVEIDNDGNNCYVFMSTNMFYISTLFNGYQIVDDKMVVYYFNISNDTISFYELLSQQNTKDYNNLLYESDCSDDLIDKSKLNIDFPKSFPDEDSDFATGWYYEPRGRKYKVLSSDSLELVFEGYY